MIEEKPWFVVQIIPEYKSDWSDALLNVWLMNDKYREELERLAGVYPHFFAHYAVQNAVPPVYFKFSVKEPQNKAAFEQWKNDHENDKGVTKIVIASDQPHQAYEEAAMARQRIFELVKLFDKKMQMRKLKIFLTNNPEYQRLGENDGKHFLRNMLKMSNLEEEYFKGMEI